MINFLFVGIGGAIGSILRYLISVIPVKESFSFPVKTFFINILGSFLIGLISALCVKNHLVNERLILLLKAGFCGGFTTFSTFALESSLLLKNGNNVTAFLYLSLSIVFGILAIYMAGFLLAKL